MSSLSSASKILTRPLGWNAATWHWRLIQAYLFVIPLPNSTGLRNVAFWAALLCGVIACRQGLIKTRWKHPFVVLFILFCVSAVLPLAIHRIDVVNSLFSVRNNLLEIGVLIWSIALARYTDDRHDRVFEILRTIAWSYGLVVVLYAVGLALYSVHYGFPWGMEQNDQIPFNNKYSIVSQLLFPLALGFVVHYRRSLSRFESRVLLALLLIGFPLLLRHQSVWPTVLVALVSFWMIARPLPRIATFAAVFGAICLLAYTALTPSNRYFSKLEQITQLDFSSEQTLSMRIGLWRYVWVCGKDAIWLGYGFDSDKSEHICRDPRIVEAAKAAGAKETTRLWSHREINAHNVALQMVFEQGIVGLTLFIAMFVLAWRSAWKLRATPYRTLVDEVFLPLLVVYLASGLLNSMWPSNPGKLIFVVIALILWCESRASERPEPAIAPPPR